MHLLQRVSQADWSHRGGETVAWVQSVRLPFICLLREQIHFEWREGPRGTVDSKTSCKFQRETQRVNDREYLLSSAPE